MKMPDVIATLDTLQSTIAGWKRAGMRIALVPTMGALHAGHLSLVDAAGRLADHVIVSIFINPAQFGPHEDFERYPRDMKSDLKKLAAQGDADLVFAPGTREFYPEDFATRIEMAGPALGLETDFRPHFFAGVATAVARLLICAAPNIAVFGEKDYQQLLVVRRLVLDLGLPVEIVGCGTVREPDGLALSSRNTYLGAHARSVARELNHVLITLGPRIRQGLPIAVAEQDGKNALLRAGFDSVDYVAVRDATTLAPLKSLAERVRVLAAATIDGTRLIDNVAA